eukprot:scaffold288251_cov43-Prasinocladus_malaysianus.AAC.1
MIEHTGEVLDEFKICAMEGCADPPSTEPAASAPAPKVWWVKPGNGQGEQNARMAAGPMAVASTTSQESDRLDTGMTDGIHDALFELFDPLANATPMPTAEQAFSESTSTATPEGIAVPSATLIALGGGLIAGAVVLALLGLVGFSAYRA